MPLETGSTIADLNASNPPQGDPLSQAAGHLRLLKAMILATFPNINDVLDITDEQLNELALRAFGFADGSVGSPSISFNGDTDTGFYRVSANKIGIAGRLSGHGATPVGAIFHFAKAPSSLGTVNTDTAKEYLECNGTVYNVSDYPDLGAFLGSTYGGNGTTTFGVPDCYTTGRFLRSRTASLAVGTSQTNALKSHTHTASSSSSGSHTHTATVTDPGHTHTTSLNSAGTDFSNQFTALVAGVGASVFTTSSNTTGITVANSTDGAHTHTVTVDSTGDTETRPEALAVVMAIKT